MKKINKIFLLIIGFIFLSTYSPKTTVLSKNEINFFNIKNITVTNNSLVKKNEIIKNLKHLYNKNIFSVKSIDIQKPLQKINFIEKVEVKKKYPDKIVIKVYETYPIGIINIKKEKFFIDSSYKLVSLNENINFKTLPNIFGEDIGEYFKHFYIMLQNHNFPIKNIKNFYFFQSERWDVQFHNNKIIKYPFIEVEEAIKKSIELINRDDFKNYSTIDLRIHGKVVVE